MFPADFAYARARSLDDAFTLLQEASDAGDEAKLIAGGQSLLPMMKLRLAAPQVLVDIAALEDLRGITSGGTRIGALTTYRELQRHQGLIAAHPAFGDALAVLADPQVRARGTVGGAVAHGDPAADLPAVLLALDASIEITASGGTRTTTLDDFLRGLFETDLAEDEIVTAITIPPPGSTRGAVDTGSNGRTGCASTHGEAYEKFPHPASHLPLAGVAAVLTLENGRIARAEVAVTGISPRPYRARATERLLDGTDPAPGSLAAAAARVADGTSLLGDQHASAPYRAHLAEVLTRRALHRAAARALDTASRATA
jgi:carbon-monoxide dehydrogenase medium subunit